MNDASPAKPRRRRGRLAAATAAALGATLLAYPGGTATAQTDIDCDAIGDNPSYGVAVAIETAVQCGVEVPIVHRTTWHSRLSATPDGRLRMVAGAEVLPESGTIDPVLIEDDGMLRLSPYWWNMSLGNEPTAPLIHSTDNVIVDWDGDLPIPSHSGTAVAYDELAAGLDFTAELGLSSANLRFTADDLQAWQSLATGLSVNDPAVVKGDRVVSGTSTDRIWVETTAFTVRDANDTVTPVHVTAGSDGALELSLPDGALETAAFPLELSTQWAHQAFYGVNDWGSVTSAAPDLAAYRGEAGLDAPYFEAAGEAGTAVAGNYCDAFADAACTEQASAASYWNLNGINPYSYGALMPSGQVGFYFQVASASFAVDAVDASDCTAPGLARTEEYSAASTWADRPAVIGETVDGVCEGGTAVYDLTDPLGDAWSDIDVTNTYEYSETTAPKTVTFGMTESAEAARFDGGSARFEVVFDFLGFRYIGASYEICDENLGRAPLSRSATPRYGGFLVNTWRSDLIDLDLTWTAAFRDLDTGETLVETGPRDVGSGPVGEYRLNASEGLPDGRYEILYTIDSGTAAFTYEADPCLVIVDSNAPEVEADLPATPQQVGDTVAFDVTASDAGFPDGWNSVTLDCWTCTIPQGEPLVLTGDDKATVNLELTDTATSFQISARDKAGNLAYSEFTVPAVDSHFDYDSDGDQDLLTVRESDGVLLFHAGDGTGGYGTAKAVGTGWGRMEVTMSGDVTGDDRSDLIARDTKTGKLYTYPGDGRGGLGTRIDTTGGVDWNAFGPIAVLDYYDDGDLDLIAVLKGNGNLWSFEGSDNGIFTSMYTHGPGWNVMDTLTGIGDYNYDGRDDALARDSRTGVYYLYPGAGNLFGTRISLGTTLGGEAPGTRYLQVTGVGDADGDGHGDLVAVNSRTGALERHSIAPDAAAIHPGEVVSSGWGGQRLPTTTMDRTYDYNGDGATDYVARVGATGTSYLYPGTGTGTHGTRVSWGTALAGMTITTAGDLNGDGFADVLARDSGGTLYLYPGTGSGALNTAGRITIGPGWNAMSAITGGHDYNSDGKADVLAVQSSNGVLYLYPGKGDGTFGSRISLGTGWNAMREVTAVGDLDHDGHADALAVRSSDGCLFFYGGTGSGQFKTSVKVGCGWNAMDAITGVGDFDRDGHVDWMARRKSDGNLYLYPGNGAGNHTAAELVGTGWNVMTIA